MNFKTENTKFKGMASSKLITLTMIFLISLLKKDFKGKSYRQTIILDIFTSKFQLREMLMLEKVVEKNF